MTLEPIHDGSGWHLDKKVPISIIVAMFVQFGAGLWFISRLDARVISLEEHRLSQITLQADRDNRQDAVHNDSLSALRSDMRDIGHKLDRLIEARSK